MVSMEIIVFWLGILSTIFVYSRLFILAAWLLTMIQSAEIRCTRREVIDTTTILLCSILFLVLQVSFITDNHILSIPLSTIVVLYLFALGIGKVMMNSLISRHQYYCYYDRYSSSGES